MEWLWQTLVRLSHHLRKGRLIGAFEGSVANSSAVFIAILFDSTNPKTTLLIVQSTLSMGLFSWWTSSCTDLTKCVIDANMHLKQNCDEHPSVHKLTFFNEFFICFFNSLTMTLEQVNAAIWEWSLDSLITAIRIFTLFGCTVIWTESKSTEVLLIKLYTLSFILLSVNVAFAVIYVDKCFSCLRSSLCLL